MKFQCRSEDLVTYGEFIKRFCREQAAKSLSLKRKCERANWNDDVFLRFADEMDLIAENIIGAIDLLSDGSKVLLLSSLCPLVEEYLKTANEFPVGE